MSLVHQQKEFLEKLKYQKEKKIDPQSELMKEYNEIVKKEKQVYGFSVEKKLIAKQLYDEI